jgi:hypothetical protein
VGALVSEPPEPLKESGFGFLSIPTAEEWNWVMREHGRAAIRRFASSEAMIQARRVGNLASTVEDIGAIIPPVSGFSGYGPAWSYWWEVAGDANETEMCADGEYLWLTAGAPGARFIRQRLRTTGAAGIDNSGIGLAYPYLACAGGDVFGLGDNGAGKPVLYIFWRADLSTVGSTVLPNVATAYAIATDGTYAAVAADSKVHLYRMTVGAPLLIGSYDHGAQINSVAMDGRFIVVGGADSGGVQIEVLAYTTTVPMTLDMVTTIGRASAATVNKVAFNGRAIAFAGAADANGDNVGLFAGMNEAIGGPLWNDVRGDRDLVVTEDGRVLGVMVSAAIQFGPEGRPSYKVGPPIDVRGAGQVEEAIYWDPLLPMLNINRVAYDFDGLFLLGEADSGGKRLKRVILHRQPKLYTVQSGTAPYRAIHSLIQPISNAR